MPPGSCLFLLPLLMFGQSFSLKRQVFVSLLSYKRGVTSVRRPNYFTVAEEVSLFLGFALFLALSLPYGAVVAVLILFVFNIKGHVKVSTFLSFYKFSRINFVYINGQ